MKKTVIKKQKRKLIVGFVIGKKKWMKRINRNKEMYEINWVIEYVYKTK